VPGLDDDDRARFRTIDRCMQHEIVARWASHRERRAGDARDRWPERTDTAFHDLFATEEICERGRRNVHEPGDVDHRLLSVVTHRVSRERFWPCASTAREYPEAARAKGRGRPNEVSGRRSPLTPPYRYRHATGTANPLYEVAADLDASRRIARR